MGSILSVVMKFSGMVVSALLIGARGTVLTDSHEPIRVDRDHKPQYHSRSSDHSAEKQV